MLAENAPPDLEARVQAGWAAIQAEAAATPYTPPARWACCPCCAVPEGQFHVLGCAHEPCPGCHKPIGWCECGRDHQWPICRGRDEEADPAAVEEAWRGVWAVYPRYPYVAYPDRCPRCGTDEGLDPMFLVPNAIWTQYVTRGHQDKLFCRPCFVAIVQAVERARGTHGAVSTV